MQGVQIWCLYVISDTLWEDNFSINIFYYILTLWNMSVVINPYTKMQLYILHKTYKKVERVIYLIADKIKIDQGHFHGQEYILSYQVLQLEQYCWYSHIVLMIKIILTSPFQLFNFYIYTFKHAICTVVNLQPSICACNKHDQESANCVRI